MCQSNFNDLIRKVLNIFFENACASFQETEQFSQLSQEYMRKAQAYEACLGDKEVALVNDYLTALNDFYTEEMDYLYVAGLRDCIRILKELKIL